MKISDILFFLIICIVLSCTQTGNQKENKNLQLDSPVEKVDTSLSILDLDGRLINADSLVFVFYKDPHGEDSLRYTRYYKQYATIDTQLINFVKDNLKDSTTRFERIKKCRSEGKIWCFTNGEIFQTIYFSSYGIDCNFLYIIKNGQFYYSKIPQDFSLKLTEMRPKAKDPGNLKQ